MSKKIVKKTPGKEEAKPKVPLNRRDFLNKSWKGLGLLAGVELTGMVSLYLFSGKGKNAEAPKQLLEAGPAESFPPGSVTGFMGGRFYLARQQDGGFIALSLRCTHLGCSIAWEENQKRFICPCHASSFTISGEVMNPPASRALDYYPVLIENGIVKVDIGTLKERNSFRKDQLKYV
jgi:cytochrome b6-f complex iron-sulfur subunit